MTRALAMKPSRLRIVNVAMLLPISAALTWGIVAFIDRWHTLRADEPDDAWQEAWALLSVPFAITAISLIGTIAIWHWRFRTSALRKKVAVTFACQVISVLLFFMACWYQQFDRVGTTASAYLICTGCGTILPDDNGHFPLKSVVWFDSKTGSDWESTTVWGTETVELRFVSRDEAEGTLLRDPSQHGTFRRQQGIAPYLRLAGIRNEPIRFNLL
jgi:hypothetical protein